ncbi:uncharacterized protein BJX67DRAFT_380625 [Aspergillus lucknowensis]|uniref:Extracellular membrane protein CFEM domain-containing protein n=1 Tax=Aspergillus lucknowensis TaxID=176173 RepID=A0ABR4LT14_9EURO
MHPPTSFPHLFQPSLILLLLIFSKIYPTTAATYPPCVTTCITNNPPNSWCNGDETGRAEEECVCRGLNGGPMIECIGSCSPDDQWEYAGGLPELCRERLFPDTARATTTPEAETESGSAVEGANETDGAVVGTEIGVGTVVLGFVVQMVL